MDQDRVAKSGVRYSRMLMYPLAAFLNSTLRAIGVLRLVSAVPMSLQVDARDPSGPGKGS